MFDEVPIDPVARRRRKIALILIAIPLIFEAHKVGMFGYVTQTIGPEWFRTFIFIPGLLALALLWVLARYVRGRRAEWQPAAEDTIRAALDGGADLLFGPIDDPVCTHTYPEGADYCIFCGASRKAEKATGAIN